MASTVQRDLGRSGLARRALTAAAVLATGAAVAGGTLAGPAAAAQARPLRAAAAAPGADPTITIRVGAVRTAENGPPGPPAATGLAGVTYRATATGFTPVTCTSTSAGLCTLNVAANRTYTVTQTSVPAGWYANPTLAAGTGGANTPRAYDSLTVAVGTANVTIPAAAPNSDTSPAARSGTWAASAADPVLPAACGLRIALLIDLSSSITSKVLPTYKAAARAFVAALKGTPSEVAIYTFGTVSPAPSTSGSNNANLAPVSTATQAGVNTLVSKINGLAVPSGSGTNWDNALWRVALDNPVYHYQSAFILTDGDPTFYGPAGNGGRGNMTRFSEVENGVFSANALKNEGTSVIGVGIGSANTVLAATDNIRAISGPARNTDFFNTDFQQLSRLLAQLALTDCAGLTVTKAASPATYTHVGQQVTYTYTVTNPKFFTLHGVHVLDDHVSHDISCTPATLATSQVASCTASYAVTQADLDRGHLTNTARASGLTPNDDTVDSGRADATVHAVQQPGIGLAKSASPVRYAAPGEIIGYRYTVVNEGNVALHGITLTDNKVGPVTCPLDTLAAGGSMTCSAAYVTTQADVDAGHIVNQALVTGHPPAGPPVAAADDATVRAIHQPAVALAKTAFPRHYAKAGETISYSYAVTNTGNVALGAIALHDDRLGAVTCPGTTLAAGDSMTCSAAYVTTQADVDRGHIVNAANVSGSPPRGARVTASGSASVHADHSPGIELDKMSSPGTYGAAGETISYGYTVTNAGNVTLHGIALRDSRLGAVTCPLTSLAPAQSMTCAAAYVTTQADVNRGHVENAAVVTGLGPRGTPVAGYDTDAVPAVHQPQVDLVKSAYPTQYGAAGERITYTYTVTNAGNVTLHNVRLADDRLGAVTCLTASLAPGQSTTCTAAHLTTPADVDAGQVSNVALVTGDPPQGPPVTAGAADTVTADHVPAIQLQKTAFPARYATPGERITYTYTVVNAGNVTLHDVTLADDRFAAVSCPHAVLAPGASMTCSAVKVTTSADVAAGHFSNVATVTGEPPSGPAVRDAGTATVYAVQHPGIAVRKTASPVTYRTQGTAITYAYTVVNTGDVTLHDLMVADSRLGAVTCTVTTLAAGRSASCYAVYTTTPADVTAGSILNVSTASGRSPGGDLVSGKAEAIVWAVPLPVIPVTG